MQVDKITSKEQLNSVLFNDPYVKLAFVSFVANSSGKKIIYVDFDLILSGYIESGLLTLQNKDITRIVPQKNKLDEAWRLLLQEIYCHQHEGQNDSIIIVDSLNGFFNQLERSDPRTITSVLMFLFKMIREANCTMIVTTMARYKKREKRWVLSPTGDLILKACKAKRLGIEWDFANKGVLVRADKPQAHKDNIHFIPQRQIPVC